MRLSELLGVRADGERQASRSDRESSLVKILADASGFKRASAPTRPIKEPLRTDSTVSRYVISPAAQKRKKEEKKTRKSRGNISAVYSGE